MEIDENLKYTFLQFDAAPRFRRVTPETLCNPLIGEVVSDSRVWFPEYLF